MSQPETPPYFPMQKEEIERFTSIHADIESASIPRVPLESQKAFRARRNAHCPVQHSSRPYLSRVTRAAPGESGIGNHHRTLAGAPWGKCVDAARQYRVYAFVQGKTALEQHLHPSSTPGRVHFPFTSKPLLRSYLFPLAALCAASC